MTLHKTHQDAVERRVIVQNEKGLHARAAAKLCVLSEKFQSELILSQDTAVASVRSVTDLMMLGAGQGSELYVCAIGPDGEAAVDAVIALFEAKFGEDA